MRIYYPDDDDGDALRAREMYGAVIERGTVVWQDIGAVSAPWWSLSKTAIASAALVLVQRGRLDLDDSLLGRGFTLRQLLYHAAGLPDYGGLAEYHRVPGARTVSVFAAVEDQGTVERAALALAKRAELA